MNRLLVLLSFLIFTSVGFGQTKILFKGKCKSKNFITEIPYEFVNYKVIIPVEIDGGKYRFLFDTGAPNMISEQVLKDIEYKSLDSIKVNDVNKENERMELVRIKHMKLGEAEFKNETAIVSDERSNFIFNCFEIDGIIGSNLLSKVIARLDHQERKLYLTDDIEKLNLPKNAKAADMHFKDQQSSPFIEVHLTGNNGSKGHEFCMFDSGMGGLFDLSYQHFLSYQRDSMFTHFQGSTGSTSIGLFMNVVARDEYRVLIPELMMGNTILENISTVTAFTSHSSLGAELLDHANITLDYINQRFYFEWSGEGPLDLTQKEFDFTGTLYKGRIAVGSVWDKALNEKIQFGDFIIQFNDIKMDEVSICDLITNKSIFRKYEKATIKFQRENGEVFELTLEKKEVK